MSKELVSSFSGLLLVQCFLNLHALSTDKIFWMGSIFSQVGPLTVELAALEHLKSPHIFIMTLR